MSDDNSHTIGGSVIQRSVVPSGLSVIVNIATVPMGDVCGGAGSDPEDLRDITARIVGIPADLILDDGQYARLQDLFSRDPEFLIMGRRQHTFWRELWEEQYRELRDAASQRGQQKESALRRFADDSLSLLAGGAPSSLAAWPLPLRPFRQSIDLPNSLGIGETGEAISTGLACLVAGATADRRVRDFVQALWTYDIPSAHSPKTTSDSLLRIIERGQKMCLAPVTAAGMLGVAQLGQGTLAPIITVATGGAMTLILISTLAVGDLVVRHMMKNRPGRRA